MSQASVTERKYRNRGFIKEEEENKSDSGNESKRDAIIGMLKSLSTMLPLKRPSHFTMKNNNSVKKEFLNPEPSFIPLHSVRKAGSTVKIETNHFESHQNDKTNTPPPLVKHEPNDSAYSQQKASSINEILKFLESTNIQTTINFEVVCTISDQDLFSQKLWIKCCRYSQCRKKILKLKNKFYCLKCNEHCYQCIRFYKFYIELSDSSGAFKLKVQDDEGRRLFGQTAEELSMMKKENFSEFYRLNRCHCGTEIKAIIQAKFKLGKWKLALVYNY